MKKANFIVLFLLSVLFNFSCSDQFENDTFKNDNYLIEKVGIPDEDVLKTISIINEFKDFTSKKTGVGMESSGKTKSTSDVASDIKVIKIETFHEVTLSEDGYTLRSLSLNKDEEATTQMYSVIFEDNGKQGYSIVCPDERIDKIYAYVENGSLNDTIYNIGLKMTLNEIKNICNDDLLNYYDKSDELTTKAQSYRRITTGNLVPLEWGQGAPYNLDCPAGCTYSDEYRGHVPAGCGAIAVAQVILYYTSLSTFKIAPYRDDFDYNALAKQNKITMSSSQYLREEAARFVYTVANIHSSIFGCGGTTTKLIQSNDVLYTFFRWNYTKNPGDEGYIVFNEMPLEACRVFDLFSRTHNLIISRGSGASGGHVWVYTGMNYQMYDDYSMKSVDQLYANWGWGGRSNGWFAFNNNTGGSFDGLRQHMYLGGRSLWGCGPINVGGGIY